MFSTLRNRFGIPGVISVIALVFAMFGGAYAASNSSGGGKATASAKAKKGPRGPKGATGPPGPAGPAGTAGAKGDSGAAGANGTNGAPGAPGASVKAESAPPDPAHCEEGGSKFTVGAATTYACNGANGADGSPWAVGGVLPVGSTETGTWVLSQTPDGTDGTPINRARASISFTVPLEDSLDEEHVHYVTSPGGPCVGSALEPTAESGHLCIYFGGGESLVPRPGETIITPDFQALGAGPSGAILQFADTNVSSMNGFVSWAVTG